MANSDDDALHLRIKKNFGIRDVVILVSIIISVVTAFQSLKSDIRHNDDQIAELSRRIGGIQHSVDRLTDAFLPPVVSHVGMNNAIR